MTCQGVTLGGDPLEDTVIPASRLVPLAQSLTVLLVPHGGQHTARRNAWAGMSGDAARVRDRREAEAAFASARAYAPSAPVSAAR